MKTTVILASLVLLASSAAFGATYVEYQGPNGNLNVPGNWYVITDSGDPASRTGVTRLPVKGGTLGSMDDGDSAIVRNATTTTINTAMEAGRWYISGPTVTVGSPPSGPTTVYLLSGGTMSLRSDGLDAGGNLYVGDVYTGTFNQAADVYTSGRLNSGVIVGNASGGTGVYNLTAGTLRLGNPAAGVPELIVGNVFGAYGQFNQSGGLVQLDGDRVIDRSIRIGLGTRGEYNLSGGSISCLAWAEIGARANIPGGTSGVSYGTGIVTQTGGTFSGYSYRMSVGDNSWEGDCNIGHYKLLGGTLDCGGHIWLGRGTGGTTGTGAGKLTVNQAARWITTGILCGGDQQSAQPPTATSAQLELKIGSASNFDMTVQDWCQLKGAVEVSLTGGYLPAPGTQWKVITVPSTHVNAVQLSLAAITPGFSACGLTTFSTTGTSTGSPATP
jgi:hypothetical protein